MKRKMGVSGGFSRHFRSFQQENMGMLMVVDVVDGPGSSNRARKILER